MNNLQMPLDNQVSFEEMAPTFELNFKILGAQL
jgi:hypothetical protein